MPDWEVVRKNMSEAEEARVANPCFNRIILVKGFVCMSEYEMRTIHNATGVAAGHV
jgi:hypothetical protein